MDAITLWLDTAVSSPAFWVLVTAGGAVCLFAFGVSTLIAGATDPVRRRLSEVAAAGPQSTASRALDLGWFVNPLAKYLVPKSSGERDSAQTHLIQAGFRSPNALRNFYGIKAMLALGLPIIVLVASRWAPQLTTNMIIFAAALLALTGVRLPDYGLGHLRQQRIKKLRNGLPDALDLLVVCVESGLGLAPAIERVWQDGIESIRIDAARLHPLLQLLHVRAGRHLPIGDLGHLVVELRRDDLDDGLRAIAEAIVDVDAAVVDSLIEKPHLLLGFAKAHEALRALALCLDV